MTYEEIVAYAGKKIAGADVSGYKGHLAVQVNITGEGEGAFYIELNDASAAVEPYEYFDRDAILTASADVFKALADGKKDVEAAASAGELRVEGNADKVKELAEVFKSKKKRAVKATAAKKPAAKKAAAKKPVAKAAKAPAKTAAKAPAKTAAKASAKATTAAKTVAAKAEKAEEKTAAAAKKVAVKKDAKTK